MENIKTKEETKEIIIGKFKPKRKFLNFVSAVNGARIRFIRDIAFIKGEKLSGILEGIIFKVTICDEGTINFEEVDTNKCDTAQIQRLIDDIDSIDVTGYAQKFVVGGLQFDDIDGKLCYLEVEHKKPIDTLKSIFDEEPRSELSDRGFSILDSLFSSDIDEEPSSGFDGESDIFVSEIDDEVSSEKATDSNDKLKNTATSFMEESFKKMNDEKVKELKKRIQDAENESERIRRDISMSESKLKKQVDDLKVLETRLDSFNQNDEPTGYVFFVSEEQKPEDLGLNDENRVIADKIADLMGLKKDVLHKLLTEGYYKIRIAEKSDMTAEKTKLTSEVLDKIKSLVNTDESVDAKITMVDSGQFEYRGTLTWHQIVGKMIRKGFEQSAEFDKHCESNSYTSHETDNEIDNITEDVKKNKKKKK